MNNDLEKFSEERLKLFELKSKYPTWDEISALARIALQGGWIECRLRMPENNFGKWSTPVAVLTDTGDVFKLSCMGGYWQRTQALIDSGGRITHWMSLPC